MKKRLLITSIVMMLVCAVALSTATYAWFTSNTSVSASTMTLKAATSDASSLGIGWTGFESGAAITSTITEVLKPMAPDVLTGVEHTLKNGSSVYEYDGNGPANIQFYTSTVKEKNSVYTFNNSETADGANVKPVVYTKDGTKATADNAADVRSFYIKNLSKANTISSVNVSAVFPGSASTNAQYAIATETTPISGKRYFTESNGVYTEIVDAARTALQSNGFASGTTYYEIASAYVLSKDTAVGTDTKYYKFTETNESYAADTYYEKIVVGGVDMYVLSTAGTAPSPYYKKELITTHANNANPSASTDPYYYEQLTGDDMIRVALFTKRYSVAVGDKVGTTKYYKYNPVTGIMDEGTLGSDLTEITTFTGFEGYYTADANHTLLGVLGKSSTELTAPAAYDVNATYFTVAAAQNQNEVNKWNFYNYFIQSGSKYVKATSYDSTKTYYQATQEKLANSAAFTAGTHYIASNTVANGEIKIDDAVKDLNYYTDVVTSITFAENLKPGEQVDIIAVMWLDGTILDDTRAGELAQVSLLFDANPSNG